MEYREVGRTGLSASAVGLGAEYLDGKPYAVVEETVHAALDHGVNIIDVFMPGAEVRANLGRALAGRRDKVLIQGHIGSVDLNQQYDISRDPATCQRYFEDLLRRLGTDYIDFGMLFYLDDDAAVDAMVDNGLVDYARDLKKNGTIRAIGASSHNPATARRVVEAGLVDMMMFSVNPAFDMAPPDRDCLDLLGDAAPALRGVDPRRADLYRLCEQRGVGLTAMKPLAAGRLLKAELSPFARAMTVGQCLHYALTRPAVASALVGCASRAEVEEAVRYADLSDADRDYAAVVAEQKGDFAGRCVYCNHCLPCPAGIDIAAVHRHLDVARLDEAAVPPRTRARYDALARRGGDCVECGACEKRCPFGVPVIGDMRRAAAVFGS